MIGSMGEDVAAELMRDLLPTVTGLLGRGQRRRVDVDRVTTLRG